MKLKDFSYKIPEALVAQEPLKNRAKARLMVIDRKKKTIKQDTFANIEKHLPKKSMLVVNDSKVVAARLLGTRQRAPQRPIEIFLLKALDDYHCKTLMRPLRKLHAGDKILFEGTKVQAKVIDIPERIVKFNVKNVYRHLNRIGHMPLPPYIKRADKPIDKRYYQTVYAKNAGSVAAPTAGLHFTNKVLKKIRAKGHGIEKVTLHVNYATFCPVEEEDITKHKMHEEDYAVLTRSFRAVKKARKEGRKIVAVGTTSARVLETVAERGELSGSTNLFIYPGYHFKIVDCLITNFHLPQSTLLMLVYALGGKTFMKKAYREAIKKKYRLYSYGDAMLIK